jgi:Hg(II)-responsive transcriptional regulator
MGPRKMTQVPVSKLANGTSGIGTFTIGRVATLADVPIDTVRYYERRGLIPRPRRTASGYRDFPAETVQQIRFIKRAQELGFTLEEIQGLLALRINGRAKCADVMHVAEHKLELIEDKITDLQSMRRALKKLVASCHTGASVVECPIIENLEQAGKKRGR